MLVSILICFSFYCHYTVRSYDQLLNTSTWKDPLHVQKQQCLANQEPSPPTTDPQGLLFNTTKFQFHKFTDFFFIVCCFTFDWILFQSHGDIDIANEWLKNLGFSQHLQLLSRKPKGVFMHLLWHRTSFSVFSYEGPSQFSCRLPQSGLLRIYSISDS